MKKLLILFMLVTVFIWGTVNRSPVVIEDSSGAQTSITPTKLLGTNTGDFLGDNFEIVVTDGSGALTTSPVVNQNIILTQPAGTGNITFTSGDGSQVVVGCSVNITAPNGDITFTSNGVTSESIFKLGTTTNATHFGVHDSSDAVIMDVFGDGSVVIPSGPLSVGNIQLNGNIISTTTGDLNINTQSGGVHLFGVSTFSTGRDASNFVQIGNNGGFNFLNAFGEDGDFNILLGGASNTTFTSTKLILEGNLQIKGGTPAIGNIQIGTDALGNSSWASFPGIKVVSETYASTDAQFLGELGLPASQGWTDTVTGDGTITLFSDTVFGVQKDVIRYITTSDTTSSDKSVSVANWTDILTFGASYFGVTRITDDISSQSIFSGTGFSASNDPRPSSIQSRVGVFISVDATHTTITLDGEALVTLDGTGGVPLVLKDEWFSWEIFIDPTPDAGTSFGNATMFVNGVSVVVGSIVSSNTAVNDIISVGNSSSTGDSTFYFSEFGITIYEDSSTKTLLAATMDADVAEVFYPKGRRDYITKLPDENDRDRGAILNLILGNIRGTVSLENQNPSTPQILYNGLRTLVINVDVAETVSGVNIVNTGNVYLGFGLIEAPHEFIDFALTSSVEHKEGRVYYDTEDKALNLKTDIVGSTQSLGQEFWIRVINKTGVSIPDGKVVYMNGFDVTSGRPTIALAKSDVEATSNAIGFVTNTMADDSEGFVVPMGFINDLDTSSFVAKDELFVSDTTAGEVTATKPLIAVSMGFATKINATTGQILALIARRDVDSPMFAQITDSVNQKPTVTTPVPITFDTTCDSRGVSHSITTATEDIIIDFDGTYTVFAQPQVEMTGGCGGSIHSWARIGTDDKGTTTSVSVATESLITTTLPHNISSGQIVEITNTVTTPDINDQHIITVITCSTFTIPVDVTLVTDGVGDWRRILDINDDLANSNVEFSFPNCGGTGVLPLIFTRDFTAGEKINIMQSISGTGQGIGIVSSTPSGESAIPSIIFTINKN